MVLYVVLIQTMCFNWPLCMARTFNFYAHYTDQGIGHQVLTQFVLSIDNSNKVYESNHTTVPSTLLTETEKGSLALCNSTMKKIDKSGAADGWSSRQYVLSVLQPVHSSLSQDYSFSPNM